MIFNNFQIVSIFCFVEFVYFKINLLRMFFLSKFTKFSPFPVKNPKPERRRPLSQSSKETPV